MKKVRVIYDPILRTTVSPVTVFDSELKILATEMLVVMHKNIGMGLAANQVGVDKNLLVLEYRPTAGKTKTTEPTDQKDIDLDTQPTIAPMALCNAEVIKSSSSTVTMTEGCLSLPGLELPVTRPSGVTVKAQDPTGKPVTIKANGLLARILQHEIDHLDGVLFTDRAKGTSNLNNFLWANIVFFGSDQFSIAVLEHLIASGLTVTAVITETDKRSGRGDKLVAPPITKLAHQAQIAVAQPETKEEITAILKQLQPDLVVLASYGKILPAESLAVPVYGGLNIHPSILPKYRGATPIQSAILNGDEMTGVTIMKMNAGVDTGEIVAQAEIDIQNTDTFLTLRSRLSTLGSQLLLKTIPTYLSGQVKLKPQGGDASGTTKLTKEMGEIDWSQSGSTIDRQIRALNPWPSSYTFLSGKRLKILQSHLSPKFDKIDEVRPTVGETLVLCLDMVQLEGKNPTSWQDFVRGHQDLLKKCSWYAKLNLC